MPTSNNVIAKFGLQVFRGYYLAKIQGELLEVNIRQAWDDLHYGTGKAGNVVPRSCYYKMGRWLLTQATFLKISLLGRFHVCR